MLIPPFRPELHRASGLGVGNLTGATLYQKSDEPEGVPYRGFQVSTDPVRGCHSAAFVRGCLFALLLVDSALPPLLVDALPALLVSDSLLPPV